MSWRWTHTGRGSGGCTFCGTGSGPVGQFQGITNQLYLLSISNKFGLEAWNSYTNPYPRTLQLVLAATVRVVVTNELNNTIIFSNRFNYSSVLVFPAATWVG